MDIVLSACCIVFGAADNWVGAARAAGRLCRASKLSCVLYARERLRLTAVYGIDMGREKKKYAIYLSILYNLSAI